MAGKSKTLNNSKEDIKRSVFTVIEILDEAQEYFTAAFGKPLRSIQVAKEDLINLYGNSKTKSSL